MIRQPPRSPLFPSTTLFRSCCEWYPHHASPASQHRVTPASPRGYDLTGNVSEKCRERSEEHTSELQSRQYLVCRLLLEKKRKVCVLSWATMTSGSSQLSLW